MLEEADLASRELLRAALARRGIVVSEADVTAAALQFTGFLRALERFEELDIAGFEPTASMRFDD